MTASDLSARQVQASPPVRPALPAADPGERPALPAPATPPPARKAGSPLWRSLTWIIALVVLGIGGYFAWSYYRGHATTPAASAGRGAGRPTPVTATRATRGDLPLYVTALGNVSAYNTVTLRTRVDGQLQKLHFSEGQLVHEGDLLFEIDPRPYQVQLTQAQGQVSKDEATLNNARQDLARFEAAAEAISKQQIDAARAAVTAAEGTVKADQGGIDAANLNLAYTRINAPVSGKIGLRLVDVGNMVHASDAAGLAVITQLQPIAATFSIPEDQLPRIQRAMASGQALQVQAWDRDDRSLLSTGVLEALDNQIDTATATVRLKAAFRNDDNVLYPNQFVNIHLLVETRKQVVLVPDVAIQRGPTDTFVYVASDTPPKGMKGEQNSASNAPKGDSKPLDGDAAATSPAQAETPPKYVEMRTVQVGPTEGHLAVIEQGLEPGEVVITDGVDKLQPGSPVTLHFAGEPQNRTKGGKAPAATEPRTGRGRGNRSASQPANPPAE